MGRILFSFFSLCVILLLGQPILAANPVQVKPLAVRDGNNEPVMIPYLGEKNLLIFYVDPEVSNQNKEFREELEKNQIKSSNIYSFGVVNLKDAPLFPNALVRSMIRKKIKQTGAEIYTDPSHLLRDGWNLGDVNNTFTLIFVNKKREIEFLRKGELTQKDIEAFYAVINKYK